MSRICIPIPNSTVIGVSGGSATPDPKTVRNESTIVSLDGASPALNALPTNTSTAGYYPVGTTVFITVSGVPAIYQLVASAAANNPPSVVRPTDYIGNLWIQRM